MSSRSLVLYPYTIDDVSVNRDEVVKELGVWLDVGLTFTNHTDSLIYRALKTLGVLKQVACDFTDPLCLKTLFCSLVHSLLEHCLVVWSPLASIDIEHSIERVQRSFSPLG